MRLEGHVAIVTGLSHAGQVGYALTAAFAREGAHLAISARGAKRMHARAEELRGAGAKVIAVPADLTTEEGANMLVAFVAPASLLGLETILGAFIAGVILRFVDGDRLMTHPQFRQKLEAIGFGVFIPVFFVTSGLRYDLAALLSSPSTILSVPIFLAALLLVRGLPALL